MRTPANRPTRAALLLAGLALLCSGCSVLFPAAPLPPMSRQQILQALRQRAGEFSTVVDTDISLRTTTTFEGKTQSSPSLGGVLAFDRLLPGLWLRTEKVGREAFDLKAIGMDFSLLLPQTGEIVTGGPIAYYKLPYLVRPDEVQTMFAGPEAVGLSWPSTTMASADKGDLFSINVFGALYRTVLVDPGTADVLRITDYDVLGRVLTDIRLSDYTVVNSTRFPLRLRVERPLDGVAVDLRLGAPKLNKPIPLQAFQPHRLDAYRHVDLDYQPLSDVHAFSGKQ
jgi:hypothetical protein